MGSYSETQADLRNKSIYSLFLQSAFKCKLKRMPEKSILDFACTRADMKIVACFEMNCKKNLASAFNTYKISLDKWMFGLELSQRNNVPFLLAVEFSDY